MQYLLERLASPPTQTLGSFEETSLAALVAAQIQRIVSARIVMAPDGGASLLDFGLPHVAEQGLHDQRALKLYAARLNSLIVQYEPRLLHPQTAIRETGKALTPYQLVVKGSLLPDTEPEEFFFELPRPHSALL